MDIQNNNVSIQINAKDQSGKQLRIADCDVFIVHVFTDDPKIYLTFSKRDMLMTEFADELVVPRHQMEQLRSGVVQYTYSYLPSNHDCVFENEDNEPVEIEHHHKHHHHFNHRHEELIHSKAVVTSIYWRNIKHPHPSAPVNCVSLFDIERLHHLIEKERIDREKDFESLQQQFGDEFDAKLDSEIERSTAEDEKINAEIDTIKADIEEINSKASESNDELTQQIADNAADITAEINRATQKEIELEQLIQGEISRAKSVEEVIETKITMEKERAQSNEANINDRVVSVTDRFDSFKTLSTESLNSEIARAKASESALNDRITTVVNDLTTEVSRAAAQDIEHTNLVNTEANRAKAVEAKIEENLSTEINRAKDAEKHLLDEVHEVQDKVTKLATSSDVYTKAEINNKVSVIDSSIADVKNWISNHTDNTDELKAKVTTLTANVDTLTSDLAAETTARTNDDITINTKLTVTDGKIDAEITRAKSVESELSDEIATLKTSVNDKTTANADAVADVAADLVKEIARAKAAEKVNADAISVITADASTAGSIKKSLADAKDYTDIEIAKLSVAKDAEIADTLKSYPTVADVDKKISDVIGTAPEALDTLGKISSTLSADSSAIGAINSVLAGKADSADVYTKSQIDSKISVINNAISTAKTESENADATINARVDDVVTKIAGIEVNIANDSSVLSAAISAESTRAKAAEKTVSDKLDSEIDKLNTKITEVNAALIEDIAKSDAKDIELEAKIDANTATITSEINRAKQVETELNEKINSIDISGQLTDYVKRSEINTYVDNAVLNSQQYTLLRSDLNAEINRAKAAEKEITDSLETINSIFEAAIDDLNDVVESASVQAQSNTVVSRDELEEVLDNYYTKEEVNELILSAINAALSTK